MSFFACHGSLFESSLFRSGVENTFVFLWLLAHCDEEGTVIARPWTIARDLSAADLQRFTETAVRAAIEQLAEPDHESRSSQAEGRRILPVEGVGHTWRIVNYRYYNSEWASERRRIKDREKKRRKRARKGGTTAVADSCPPPVPSRPLPSPPESESKTESDSETESNSPSSAERRASPYPSPRARHSKQRKPFAALGAADPPLEWVTEAARLGATEVDAREEFYRFADYWRGTGETKADWLATWRNWIRNRHRFRPRVDRASGASSAERERLASHFAKYDAD